MINKGSASDVDGIIESAAYVPKGWIEDETVEWLQTRRHAHSFHVEEIPFSKLEKWTFDPATGNLKHDSGRFFTIEGLCVSSAGAPVSEWSQPIINQPEIGILGFLCKRIDGILRFLVQAKMEPGNINLIQLSPTVQATRSNFTRVHEGAMPPYLSYFVQRNSSRTIVDVLQSEQGARFFRKRNRNVVLEVFEDVPAHPDFQWLTLGQLHQLAKLANLVNMDARTVLACIPFASSPRLPDVRAMRFPAVSDFQKRIAGSAFSREALHSPVEFISWLTEAKFRCELSAHTIPLSQVNGWIRTDMEMHHESFRFFKVIAVRVHSTSREVRGWTQPLVTPAERGVNAFLVKDIRGILHFLVRAAAEPGNFDRVEAGPTVQCQPGSYGAAKPRFLDYVLNAKSEQIRYSSLQSEEGGRFFHESNLNLVVEADTELQAPEGFIWLSLRQLKDMMQFSNVVNVQARCLLACLGLFR
jgi:dTDP-4-dehydro-6-deoxy-alpha-D-glucopyranose 2,3-dehydratase